MHSVVLQHIAIIKVLRPNNIKQKEVTYDYQF